VPTAVVRERLGCAKAQSLHTGQTLVLRHPASGGSAMQRVTPCLAVITSALVAVAGCDGGPEYTVRWTVPDTVTLPPGESVALPFTVLREAENQGEVSITLEGAPDGVTLTPAEFSIPERQDTISAEPTLVVAADTPAPLQTVSDLVLVSRDPSNNFTAGARIYFSLLAPPAPQPDFSLSVEPRQLNLNVGQRRPVAVTVTRAAGFTGPLTLTLDSPNTRIQTEPLTLAGDQTTATVTVITDGRMARVPVATRFVATAEDGRVATTGFTVNLR